MAAGEREAISSGVNIEGRSIPVVKADRCDCVSNVEIGWRAIWQTPLS